MIKKIIYTDHSLLRKYERDISDKEIEEVIKKPDYLIASSDGRQIARKKINNRVINVVYKDRYIIIVTVY
ncbi:MAG: DUF4258 domain-containing protein [Candidatus Aenigmarchaeota archaeon]|nr:DUF4258 domain-containing protein [Candidatus Aenigmarchaeota archaeon]